MVNTCAFIEEAQQESIDTILEVVGRKGQGVDEVLVAGCMVNRFGDQLAREIPEIDGFVGLDQLRDVGEVVQLGGGPPLPAPSHMVFDHTAPRLLTTRGFAYLKVAEGCNNPCTFCAIPIWRGRFRSRTIESLVDEARQLEAAGIPELNLIAQDTTRYGEDLGLRRHGLVRLVEALLARHLDPLDPLPLRLSDDARRGSAAPDGDRGALLLLPRHAAPAQPRRHPLGHAAGRRRQALPAPARTGARAGAGRLPALDLHRRLPGRDRGALPDLSAVRRAGPLRPPGRLRLQPRGGHAGRRAARAGCRGTSTRRRLRQLLEAQRPIALERRRRLLGRRLTVLVEGPCEETEHLLQGRHHGMAPEIDGRLLINDGSAPAGTLAEVEITEAYADDLVGHIVGRRPAPGRRRGSSQPFRRAVLA